VVKVLSFVLLTLPFAAPVFADSVSVGYLINQAGSPTGGEQQITVFNVTGASDLSGCEAYGPPFSACSNLTFTDWTLTVNYTSDYYSPGTGSVVYSDSGSGPYGGFGDIDAGGSLTLPALDLCANQAVCDTPLDPDTQITSVVFSGEITPDSFTLCDNTVPTCAGTTAATFFADPDFSLTWNSASPTGGSFATGGPYVDDGYEVGNYDNYTAESPDITVTDQVSAETPEPGGFLLVTGALPFLFVRRRLK
jgi:hypothetical protein